MNIKDKKEAAVALSNHEAMIRAFLAQCNMLKSLAHPVNIPPEKSREKKFVEQLQAVSESFFEMEGAARVLGLGYKERIKAAENCGLKQVLPRRR